MRLCADPRRLLSQVSKRSAGVAELVDATDLKSVGSNPVPVQVRPPAPLFSLAVSRWRGDLRGGGLTGRRAVAL